MCFSTVYCRLAGLNESESVNDDGFIHTVYYCSPREVGVLDGSGNRLLRLTFMR